MTMKTVCAWCLKHLKGPEHASLVSHGMCPDCFNNARRQLGLHIDPTPDYRDLDDEWDELIHDNNGGEGG